MQLQLPEYVPQSEFTEAQGERLPGHDIVSGEGQILSFYYTTYDGEEPFARADARILRTSSTPGGMACVDIEIDYLPKPIAPLLIILGADNLAPLQDGQYGFFSENLTDICAHMASSFDILHELDDSVLQDA